VLQFIDNVLAPLLHDRMTQCRYDCPPETFCFAHTPQPVHFVDVIGEGRAALDRANTELGLSLSLDFHLFYVCQVFLLSTVAKHGKVTVVSCTCDLRPIRVLSSGVVIFET